MKIDCYWMQIHPYGGKGSLNGWISMKNMWIICFGLHSYQIATQLNRCGRFWSDMLPPPSSKQQNVLSVELVIHLVESGTWGIYAKEHWSFSGGTWWNNTLDFPLICHLSVYTHFKKGNLENTHRGRGRGIFFFHIFQLTYTVLETWRWIQKFQK